MRAQKSSQPSGDHSGWMVVVCSVRASSASSNERFNVHLNLYVHIASYGDVPAPNLPGFRYKTNAPRLAAWFLISCRNAIIKILL